MASTYAIKTKLICWHGQCSCRAFYVTHTAHPFIIDGAVHLIPWQWYCPAPAIASPQHYYDNPYSASSLRVWFYSAGPLSTGPLSHRHSISLACWAMCFSSAMILWIWTQVYHICFNCVVNCISRSLNERASHELLSRLFNSRPVTLSAFITHIP